LTFIPTPQTQGYKGVVLIGGTSIPVLSDPSVVAPENDVNPPIIGNFFESPNYAQGLIEPIINFNFAVRDNATELFGTTFLDYFWTRSNDAAHDTSIIEGGITFWDGVSGWQMNGVKADSLSISATKTGGPRVSGRFCASNAEGTDAMVALTEAPSFTGWDNTPLLYGQNITFGGALAGRPMGFDLNISNNSRPNNAFNGSRYPEAYNASMMTAGFQLQMRAADTIPADGTGIAIVISGTGWSRTLTVQNPLNQTPKNRTISYPEVMRSYSFKCLQGASNTAPVVFT
jgi:hypothetical protein